MEQLSCVSRPTPITPFWPHRKTFFDSRQPERHHWFRPYLNARGQPAKALTEAVLDIVEHHEADCKLRKRARKAGDQELHERRVEAVVCNLARAVLCPPPTGRIATPLGHRHGQRSRYDSPIMGKPFAPLVETLSDLGILDLKKQRVMSGETSSVAPTAWFARKVVEFGIQLSDFGHDEADEVILLKRNTDGENGDRRRERIDYADTEHTIKDRENVRYLNEFLKNASIDFMDDGLEPRVDPFDRIMKRHYTILEGQDERFDQNGRLFGGFWQNLKKSRRGNILIEGEHVAVLDYSSMFTRLAFAYQGKAPPDSDLYAIPGLVGYRSGVKKAMNIFLFDQYLRRDWPDEIGIGVGDDDAASSNPDGEAAAFEGRLPEGWTVSRLRNAVLKEHPILKNAWGKGLGYTLMHQESEILIAVLLDLASRNIPALGLHDGLLVAQRHVETAGRVMELTSHRFTGVKLPVTCELLGQEHQGFTTGNCSGYLH